MLGVIKAPFQPLVQLGVVAIVVGSCEDDDGVELRPGLDGIVQRSDNVRQTFRSLEKANAYKM